jgi:class 3 adenylate cyclase
LHCTNCGAENAATRRFCLSCGAELTKSCPRCSSANEPVARFCGSCGSALPDTADQATASPAVQVSPSPTEAERRLVSVLFADLVGFTTYSESRDAEEVRDLQDRYFATVTEIIARYGGRVEKFIGDAVMALWGAPVAREDDAERAVRAGLDLVAAIRTMAVDDEAPDSVSLEARAGVMTGEAAVALAAANQGMVSGDLVNTASRLQSVAPSGSVLVGEATQRAASRAVVFEQAGEQLLRGKVSPVPAWRAVRVVAQRGGVGRSEALEAPFVGRDEELRQLKDHFHATSRERRARLVSVIGPAGHGKSRLAWEFLKYIDGLAEDVWWHDGRSPAYGEGISFWALGEMIRSRAGLQEDADEPTTRAAITGMLEQHIPDAGERAWLEPAMLSLLGIEVEVGSEQLFGAWRTFFERLAASAPVVMVFEDFHYADAGLLDFVDQMLEWSRSVPIFILTLARPELLDRRPSWGAGKRSFTSVHLEPLPAEAMRDLLEGLVPGIPEAAREAIVERAEGVPLYAVETVRMLLAQGRVVLDGESYRPAGELTDLAVPETLTALISARLDELDSADRALIADAAVLGQSFSTSALAAMSGAEGASLEPRLRAMVRRELLVQQVDPRSPERGHYAFVQALIREVAYNTLAKQDRKVRHLAAARYFESLGNDELAGALAGHYLAAQGYAADGPESEALAGQARIALRGAAERAAALGSHGQAITFLERAVEISPDARDRAELHEKALVSAMHGLSPEVAERHARAAVEARRDLGDREAIALALAAHGEALHFFDINGEHILELMLPAWEEFADLEQSRAGVRLMLAVTGGYVRSDESQVRAWLERVLPVAERLDLLEETAMALHRLAGVLYRSDRQRQAMMILRGTHELAVANNLAAVHRNTRTALTFYEQMDDPRAGLAMAREGLEIAARLGSSSYGFMMVGNAFSTALRMGEWDWASGLLDEWLEREVTGGFFLELYADRAVLRTIRGQDPEPDLAAAAALLPQTEGDTQYTSYLHWARAWQALCAGRLADARREAQGAVDTTAYFLPIALPLAARAALWQGSADVVGDLLDRLDAATARGRAFSLDRVTLRAGLAACEGRRAEAVAGYREALRGWQQLGCAFDECLAVLDMAVLLAPTESEMAEAPVAIRAARETLLGLGAVPLVARLDDVGIPEPRVEHDVSSVPAGETAS